MGIVDARLEHVAIAVDRGAGGHEEWLLEIGMSRHLCREVKEPKPKFWGNGVPRPGGSVLDGSWVSNSMKFKGGSAKEAGTNRPKLSSDTLPPHKYVGAE